MTPFALLMDFLTVLVALALVLGLSGSVLKTRRVQKSSQQSMEKAQARLARSEHEMAVLMRSVQELIFRTDIQGRLTFVNARWEQWTGQPSVEALGQPLEGIAREACRPQIHALLDPQAKQQDHAAKPQSHAQHMRQGAAQPKIRARGHQHQVVRPRRDRGHKGKAHEGEKNLLRH